MPLHFKGYAAPMKNTERRRHVENSEAKKEYLGANWENLAELGRI